MKRIIAHLDMDAFFAVIEERDRPRLKGKPIVVGADPQDGRGRGVVSTANYKAREYGIRSALPISKAWQFSEEARKNGKPPAVFISGSFKKYSAVSAHIMEIIEWNLEQARPPKFPAGKLERASVDEAYFDLSSVETFKKAVQIAKKIKADIKKKERLTCSVGIGPNKLIAKIASDMQKPDGLTVVTLEQVAQFLEPLSIRKIPGIGPKTEEQFNKLNIKTIKQAKSFSKGDMKSMLGKWGESLYDKVRGISNSPLVEEREAKSIGEQETFEKDTKDPNFILERLKTMSDSVVRQMKRGGFTSFKTIAITVRFSDFETKTRAHTLKETGDTAKILYFEGMKLLMPFLSKTENPRNKLVRLIGIRIEKLS